MNDVHPLSSSVRLRAGQAPSPGKVRVSPPKSGLLFGKLARWNPKSTESWPEDYDPSRLPVGATSMRRASGSDLRLRPQACRESSTGPAEGYGSLRKAT